MLVPTILVALTLIVVAVGATILLASRLHRRDHRYLEDMHQGRTVLSSHSSVDEWERWFKRSDKASKARR